jgi:hypothetical protein
MTTKGPRAGGVNGSKQTPGNHHEDFGKIFRCSITKSMPPVVHCRSVFEAGLPADDDAGFPGRTSCAGRAISSPMELTKPGEICLAATVHIIQCAYITGPRTRVMISSLVPIQRRWRFGECRITRLSHSRVMREG